MANKIQIRRDTTANWASSNPILSQGELGLDTTLNKIKIGNGTSNWSALSFFFGDPTSLINGLHTVSLDANGDLILADNGGIVFDRNNTSIRVGMGFHIASGEGIGLEAIDNTDPENLITKGWYFSPSGGITFPTLTVELHNGNGTNNSWTGQVLKFDDASQQVIITGPTPAAGNSAERIIIQGQRATGRNSINNQDAEGGDVYLWGGDSDYDGGDIKIYAGDADANNTDFSGSIGGYVNIDAGEGYTRGGHISLSAGGARGEEVGVGGDITLSAGSAYNGTPGNIIISTRTDANYSNNWLFTNNGKLQLPDGGDVVNSNGSSVLTGLYKFSGNTFGTKANPDTLNGWGAYDMYLDPGGESAAYIYIPSNENQTEGASLQILNKGAATSIVQVVGWGGVQLVTNTGSDENIFEFNDNGTISFPNNKLKTPSSLIVETTSGIPSSVTKTSSSQGWGVGTGLGTDLPTTGGSGTGLTVDVVDTGSAYAGITIHTPGSGYQDGESLTVTHEGMSDTFTVTVPVNNWTFGTNGSLTFPDTVSNISALDPAQSGGITGVALTGKNRAFIGIINDEFNYNWDFRASGAGSGNSTVDPTIQFPGGGWLKEDMSALATGGFDTPAQLGSQGAFTLTVKNNNTFPAPASTYNWVFGTDGNLTLPGSITKVLDEDLIISTSFTSMGSPPGPQTSSFTFGANGDLTVPHLIKSPYNLTLSCGEGFTTSIEAGLNGTIEIGYQPDAVDIHINASGAGTTTTIWSDNFKIMSTAPTSSKGKAGDEPGMFAFSASYAFFCTINYTDGNTDIWRRVALTGGTW